MNLEPINANRCPRTSQMTASSAQICRDMGWEVGTVLSARDPDGTERQVRITAVGETQVLVAYRLLRDEPVPDPVEMILVITCRDWEKA